LLKNIFYISLFLTSFPSGKMDRAAGFPTLMDFNNVGGARHDVPAGKHTVKNEFILLCFGYSINKLHTIIQNENEYLAITPLANF